MAKGARKGASFERKISKELSLWVSRGERTDIFWRSAMSGGRATVGMKAGVKLSAQAGDVSAIDSLGQKFINAFMVECKHYKNVDFDAFVRRQGLLYKFWIRTCQDANTHGKVPFLIVRQNNWPIMIFTTGLGCTLLRVMSIEVHWPKLSAHMFWYDSFINSYGGQFRKQRHRVRLSKKRVRL